MLQKMLYFLTSFHCNRKLGVFMFYKAQEIVAFPKIQIAFVMICGKMQLIIHIKIKNIARNTLKLFCIESILLTFRNGNEFKCEDYYRSARSIVSPKLTVCGDDGEAQQQSSERSDGK